MLFARRPYHLSEEEADRWMRSQAVSLVGATEVRAVEMTRLVRPASGGGSEWDWLIELHCDGAEEARRAARDDACRELIADLRLLGMSPSLVVANSTTPLES